MTIGASTGHRCDKFHKVGVDRVEEEADLEVEEGAGCRKMRVEDVEAGC